jgi:hypothetical protein
MPIAEPAGGRSAADCQAAVERFLKASRQPALLEPGEDLLPLTAGNFVLETRAGRLTLQAWDRTRNFVRRVAGIKEEARGRLELTVERFARRQGSLYLIDLAHPAGAEVGRRGPRRVFRERFREMLSRQFPGWKIAELTVEADLEHSLSPAYPRALVKHGHSAWAAIAAGPDPAGAPGVLSFGLIWLDYLRRREPRLAIEGLTLFVASGCERPTCLRLLFLDPAAAAFRVFAYSEQGFVVELDPRDFGNLDTRLEVSRRPRAELDALHHGLLDGLAHLDAVERIARPDGSVSLRVRGVEFARAGESGVVFGLTERVPLGPHNADRMTQLAAGLARERSPATADRAHPSYRRHPEAWLESQVRRHLEQLDASLLPEPVYNQVPAFAAGDRGVMDLLAVDRSGRLAVLELKASADLHLPLQALDYWMRVKWHLDRREFTPLGYFPGIELAGRPPRLVLVSPALEFHPTTEAILRYFSPAVDVVRIGVGLEWRKRLEIMFRLRGSEHPEQQD